jgi:hypothetical protein
LCTAQSEAVEIAIIAGLVEIITMEPVTEPAVAKMSRLVTARTALSHNRSVRLCGAAALSQRTESEQAVAVGVAGSSIIDRQAADCAAQDATVKRLIDALQRQEIGHVRDREDRTHDRPFQ